MRSSSALDCELTNINLIIGVVYRPTREDGRSRDRVRGV
jgi:hypothetical protein